jgi:hypothetical protein
MKTRVRRIVVTMVVVAVGALLLAAPVAARPKDPDGFQVTHHRPRTTLESTGNGQDHPMYYHRDRH